MELLPKGKSGNPLRETKHGDDLFKAGAINPRDPVT
jgi:hypothetical protein